MVYILYPQLKKHTKKNAFTGYDIDIPIEWNYTAEFSI